MDVQERLKKLIEPHHDLLTKHLSKFTPTLTQIVEQDAALDLVDLHRSVA